MIALSPQAAVKAQARSALKHKYASAVIALLIALVPLFLIDTAVIGLVGVINLITSNRETQAVLFTAIAYPVALMAGVLLSPFLNGFVRVYYRNALSGEMDLNDLFYYFGKYRYSRTLLLNLSFALRLLLPGLCFFLPVVFYAVICYQLNNGFYGSVLYDDFYFILTVMSTTVLTLYSLKYFTVLTLYVEDGEQRNKEIFRASKYIMSGQAGNAAKLIFSYTPWILLCLTVLPMLYVIPYMTQGLCIGAKWMTRAAYEESL